MERLRYTGCWPPLDVLERFPNWAYALEEEDEEDQDETTIRPEDQQSFISQETAFTAAVARCPDGRELTVVLSVQDGAIEGADIFGGQDWWPLRPDESGEELVPREPGLVARDGRPRDGSEFVPHPGCCAFASH